MYLAPAMRVRPVMTETLMETGSFTKNQNEPLSPDGPMAKPYNPDENPFHFKSVWE
ncbi:MAG: hypothetical protein IJ605_00310 [Prevotella sp.]|nr:hypothetical protein [Prevotella sp.]